MRRDGKNKLSFGLESVEKSSPIKRSDGLESAILNCLSHHPEGITAQLISEHTGISQRTVKKHLDQLTVARAAVRREYGSRISIYFPISKQNVGTTPKTIEIGDSTYQLQLIENTWGRFIYVQEVKRDIYSGMTKIIGGLTIECDDISGFVRAMKEVAFSAGCDSDA